MIVILDIKVTLGQEVEEVVEGGLIHTQDQGGERGTIPDQEVGRIVEEIVEERSFLIPDADLKACCFRET